MRIGQHIMQQYCKSLQHHATAASHRCLSKVCTAARCECAKGRSWSAHSPEVPLFAQITLASRIQTFAQ
eukprot:scaffold45937_cov24-Tisochrysis_lutea.AAC.5